MSGDRFITTSPRAEPMGLHINPSTSRSRGPSTTSELGMGRSALGGHRRAGSTSATSELSWTKGIPSGHQRLPSSTSMTPNSPLTPGTPLDNEVFTSEKSPLINKTLRHEDSAVIMSTFSHSVSSNLSQSLGSLSITILQSAKKKGGPYWLHAVKTLVLFVITLLCCVTILQFEERDDLLHEVVVGATQQVIYSGNYDADYPILDLKLMGPLEVEDNNATATDRDVQVRLDPSTETDTGWLLRINETALLEGDIVELQHQFRCNGPRQCNISLRALGDQTLPVVYHVHEIGKHIDHEILYAALILVFVYILIIFELVPRTLAAMLGALAALAVLSAINQRPTTATIIGWMEMETLMLLFGMMIIVAVLSDTGIFDYSALKAYQLAEGKVWPLVTLLCAFSAVVSAFLDNVTTILLMAPVTIRLCEVLNLEPRVILIAEVLFSNIGGTATAIGDPPNVIIVSALESFGITFSVFTAHLVIGIIFITVVAYGFLRLYYRNMQQLSNADPPEIAELNHEIAMWRRASGRLVVVTREETLMKALFMQKTVELENLLNKTIHRKRKEERIDLDAKMRELEREYRIKDMGLLLKCGFVLLTVLIFFFMYSFVSTIHVSLGWVAVLGAMWLLVIADVSDMDSILHKVEWSTLLFFAALFVLMEALAELHLMQWIGERMRDMILNVEVDYRTTAAVVIIVWISALASSFIDNIPYTTAMIPVLKQLSADKEVDLELLPLVMALAFGACLGGNGTLIGASANVVCAGIAEQHGYTISFKQFFKVGFPMMLVTTLTATVYLLICHSAIKWNSV